MSLLRAMTSQKPILLSGAGLSSLLLARALLSHSIPFEIYERDASFDVRGHGYRLRLSEEGIDAVESVLDPASFQRWYDGCSKTSTGGKGIQSFDAVTGEEKEVAPQNLTSRGGKVVGVARGFLRKSLMEGCENHIHWGKGVVGYEMTPGGDGVHALFEDGTKSPEGQMLIAGDGIHSRIAQQLSEGKLKVYDTGARLIHGQASTTAFKALGEGVFGIHDVARPSGKLFLITNVRPEDMDDPNVEFGWTMSGEPGTISAPNDDFAVTGAPAADLAKRLTSDWHPKFRSMIEQMNVKEAGFWKMTCSSPKGIPEWTNNPRVTVIGDSVHSMTPAAGIGANTAMRDSALLGRLLREAGGFRDGLTAEYEKEMRVYGAEAVRTSYGTARKVFHIRDLEAEV
jgi:2-polyprenyl-6-methoxyphenol hydroxylase-like FAD-dependent oxidoreductase